MNKFSLMKIQIIVGIFSVAGCGTISGRKQYISIDSEPRTVAVEPVGESESAELSSKSTPAFIYVNRSSELRLKLKDGNGKVFDQTERCHLRWDESIVPDSLVALAGLANPAFYVIGALSLLTDGMTGAIHDCDDTYRFKLPGGVAGRKNMSCYKYIVLPYKSLNAEYSDKVVNDWIQFAKPRLASCDQFIFGPDLHDELAFFNVDHRKEFDLSSLGRAQMNEIGFTLRADRIVRLSEVYQYDRHYITPEIYDLHTYKSYPYLADSLSYERKEKEDTSAKWWFKAFAYSLIPNAINFALISNDVSLNGPSTTTSPEIEVTAEDENTGMLPHYITALSVSRITHPYGYGAWDYDFETFSSFDGTYQDQTLKYRKRFPIDSPEESVRTRNYLLVSMVNFGPIFFTPMGSFGFFGAVGPVTGYYTDDAGHSELYSRFGGGFVAEYDYFFSSRFFLEFGVKYIGYDPARLNQYVRSSYLSSSYLSFGYFIPEVRSRTVELIK